MENREVAKIYLSADKVDVLRDNHYTFALIKKTVIAKDKCYKDLDRLTYEVDPLFVEPDRIDKYLELKNIVNRKEKFKVFCNYLKISDNPMRVPFLSKMALLYYKS